MLQNQQYYQPPANYGPANYQMPYQNYQAQQRQEQLNQAFANTYCYNYVRERAEAENWHIAPGNHLVFEDQNGVYFYTKSLGFAPNDKPVFSVFKREDYIPEQQIKQEPEPNKYDKDIQETRNEVNSLKGDIEELKTLISQLTTKPKYDKYDKRGGGK